jgi:hypothetical protein
MHEVDAAKKRGKKGQDRRHRQKNLHAAVKPAKKCGGQPCGAGNTCLTGRGKPACCPDDRVCGQACLPTACPSCERCDIATGHCIPSGGPLFGPIVTPCGPSVGCRCMVDKDGRGFCGGAGGCNGPPGPQLCSTDASGDAFCAGLLGPGAQCVPADPTICADGLACAAPCELFLD